MVHHTHQLVLEHKELHHQFQEQELQQLLLLVEGVVDMELMEVELLHLQLEELVVVLVKIQINQVLQEQQIKVMLEEL